MQQIQNGNYLIQKPDIENILNKINNIGDNGTRLSINNEKLYQLAFVHKSFLRENSIENFYADTSNEVMEFLGDAFIGCVVGKYLVDRFEDQQEGFLTKIRTRIVRSSMLSKFARFLDLGRYILLSTKVERLSINSHKGRNNPRLYEDCFEAFVGAIIQDFGDEEGYKYAKRFIINIIEYLIDFSEIILCNENLKDTLQRYFQYLKIPNPIYIDLGEFGPSNYKTFTKGIFLDEKYLFLFSNDIQKQIINYHNNQLKNLSITKIVRDAIVTESQNVPLDEHLDKSYIVGFGNTELSTYKSCWCILNSCQQQNYFPTDCQSQKKDDIDTVEYYKESIEQLLTSLKISKILVLCKNSDDTYSISLPGKYLFLFSPIIQSQIISFHNQNITYSKNTQNNTIHTRIKYIIGLGKGNKKNIAEQDSADFALCCLNIDKNWKNE